jgi:hypothetical protein
MKRLSAQNGTWTFQVFPMAVALALVPVRLPEKPVRNLRAEMRAVIEECLQPHTSYIKAQELLRQRVLRLYLGVCLGVEPQDPAYFIPYHTPGVKLTEGSLCGMLNELTVFLLRGSKMAVGGGLFTTMEQVIETAHCLQLTSLMRMDGAFKCVFLGDGAAEALAKSPLVEAS